MLFLDEEIKGVRHVGRKCFFFFGSFWSPFKPGRDRT